MRLVKNFLFFTSVSFFVFFCFLFTVYINSTAQSLIIPKKEKVVYQLPYPGILPDHPLYFVKLARDRLLIFFTRDPIKKAENYLLLSDKRVAMSEELVKKNKYQLAVSTFSKGEKYFLKAVSVLKEAKKQGVSPTPEFKERLKSANKKHQQVINFLLSSSPKNLVSQIELLYKLNEEIKIELQRL